MLWTNGGPGCSGLGGFLTEQGPFRPAANGTAVHSAYDPGPSTIGRTDRAPTDLPLTTSSTVGAEVYAWIARVALPLVSGQLPRVVVEVRRWRW